MKVAVRIQQRVAPPEVFQILEVRAQPVLIVAIVVIGVEVVIGRLRLLGDEMVFQKLEKDLKELSPSSNCTEAMPRAKFIDRSVRYCDELIGCRELRLEQR